MAPADGKRDSFLVCIVSDGYENASRRHSSAEVSRTIGRLTDRETGPFAYLGANQDLSQVSAELNIPRQHLALQVHARGYAQLRRDRRRVVLARRSVRDGKRSLFPKNFYSRVEEEEELNQTE